MWCPGRRTLSPSFQVRHTLHGWAVKVTADWKYALSFKGWEGNSGVKQCVLFGSPNRMGSATLGMHEHSGQPPPTPKRKNYSAQNMLSFI